jgi:hypothetical protein
MNGIAKDVIILHWDETRAEWDTFAWSDWVRFRAFVEDRLPELSGAKPGEHYFVVCMMGERGDLADVIPHKYILSADGRLVHAFDGLDAVERAERRRLGRLPAPTVEDTERYNELCTLGFAVNLPPPHTVAPLLKSMPGLAGAQPTAACWRFLSAIGINSSSSRRN